MCFLIAIALGIAMSTLFGPLVLAITGGLLKLAAWAGCVPSCRRLAHGIGSFAGEELFNFHAAINIGFKAETATQRLWVIRKWAAVSLVLAPIMIAAACAWMLIRRSLARAAMVDLVASTRARPPRPDDARERLLVNVTDEMALAAGLPSPRIRIIDAEIVNAGVSGVSHEAATVVVTRGLLDRLDRDEVQAVMAHCIGSVGNGDLRVMQSVLATLLTLGLFHTILDLPFRWSAWPTLAAFARATSPRASPATAQRAAKGIEEAFSAESLSSFSLFILPLFPLRVLTLFQRMVLIMWCILVLDFPLALMWRARRHLADGTAVQLTRNPDALASALSQMTSQAGIPEGGESREYMFICGAGRRESAFGRYGVTTSMHPGLKSRLKRIRAMGAAAARDPKAPINLRTIIGTTIFGIIALPFLVIGVLAAIGGLGIVLWLSLFTVLISMLLGLGFVSWAFG